MLIFYIALFITFSYYWLPLVEYKNRKINIYALTMFLTLSVLAIIRYDVGTDFMNYYNNLMTFEINEWRYEPGFSLINLTIKELGWASQSLFLISTTIIMSLMYISIKKYSVNISLSVFIFIFGFFYFDSLNIIRQYIAAVIIIFGHIFVLKDKKTKFIIFVLIATLFHYSALISLVFLFFKNVNYLHKKIFLLFVLTTLIFSIIFSEQVLNLLFSLVSTLPLLDEYVIYKDSIGEASSKPYSFIVYIFIYLMTFFMPKHTFEKYEQYLFYRNTLLIAIILKGIALNFKFIDRISIYFDLYIIFLIPIVYKEIKWKYKKLFMVVMLISFVIYCWVRIYTGQAGVKSYKTIFSI